MTNRTSFSDRIKILFMAATGSLHPRGAMAWFARRASITHRYPLAPRTLRRYCKSEDHPDYRAPPARVYRILKAEEREVTKHYMSKARERYREYLERPPRSANDYERLHQRER